MVVMDPTTREVLALVGGYDYHAGGFDRSQRAHRQPGSAFKPFIYAAAIEAHRITPATILNDAPEVYELWKPQNYEKEEFRGPVRVRTALAHSINTVAIKVLSDVGLDQARAVRDARRRDVADPERRRAVAGARIAGDDAARAGQRLRHVRQRRHRRAAGLDPRARRRGAAARRAGPDAEARGRLRHGVADAQRGRRGDRARRVAGKLRRPAAGKTGTSNDQRDAWFVGFTPDLLAAVWVGFDDMKKLGRGEAGGKTAAPIWADFMTKAMAGPPDEGLRAAARDRRPAHRQGERPAVRRRPGVEHARRGVPRRHRADGARRRGGGEEASPDKLLME